MKLTYLVFLLFILSSCKEKVAPVFTGREGKVMPDFKLLLTDSSTLLNSMSIPDGRPVVMIYFSPHCPYCRQEITQVIGQMAGLQDIQFYLFSTYPMREVAAFAEDLGLSSYRNVHFGLDIQHVFLRYFGATAVPYTAIYGRQKKLTHAFLGVIDAGQIRDMATKN